MCSSDLGKVDSLALSYGSLEETAYQQENYQSIKDIITRSEDYGFVDSYTPEFKQQVYSNSFANMRNELELGVGYEFKGALPDWMQSVQPETNKPLGFVRALVLAYANPGQGDKLLYRYQSSLAQSGYAVVDIMNTFKLDRKSTRLNSSH